MDSTAPDPTRADRARGSSRLLLTVGVATIVVATPSAVWRVLVGLGLPLGTPPTWRLAQGLPGAGTGYVLGLSVLQLLAAAATLVLVVPDLDRVPRRSPLLAGRRLPLTVVAGGAFIGITALLVVCAASAVAWDRVDPFAGTPVTSWAVLARACYAIALLWPVLLLIVAIGYTRARRSERAG